MFRAPIKKPADKSASKGGASGSGAGPGVPRFLRGPAATEGQERQAERAASSAEAAASVASGTPERPLPPGSGGRPLPGGVRASMERRFGASFGGVRVHDGAAGAATARAMGARAVTRGQDVHFAAGAFQPGTPDGAALISHELTHVVQQQQAGSTFVGRQSDDDASDDDDEPAIVGKEASREAVRAKLYDGLYLFVMNRDEDDVLPLDLLEEGLAGWADEAFGFAEYEDPYYEESNTALLDALEYLSGVQATLTLAGQDDPATLTYASACKLLVETLGSPELVEFGLPDSYGTWFFLEVIAGDIAWYICEALTAIDRAVKTHAKAIEDGEEIADASTYLANAVSMVWASAQDGAQQMLQFRVDTFNDPYGLIEVELQGAVEWLKAARSRFAAATTDAERAEEGAAIGETARMILLLSKHLEPLDKRIRDIGPPDLSSYLGQLAGGDAIVADLRTAAVTEGQTLQRMGNSPSLLSPLTTHQYRPIDVDLVDYDGPDWWRSPESTPINPSEAFPEHTDATVQNATYDIAERIKRQAETLAVMKSEIVPPEDDFTLQEFMRVHRDWMAFFSPAARDKDPNFARMNLLLRGGVNPATGKAQPGILGLASLGGLSGYVGRAIAVESLAASMNFGRADPQFGGMAGQGVSRHSDISKSAAGSDGRMGVTLEFAELTPKGGRNSLGGEVSSRNRRVNSAIEKTAGDFTYVYEGATGVDRLLRTRALGYARTRDEVHLMKPGPARSNEDNWKGGWSYMLFSQIFRGLDDIIDVREHKSAREEVAQYLVASAQHYATVAKPHYIDSSQGIGTESILRAGETDAIGDEATRSVGVEGERTDAMPAHATAVQRYILGEHSPINDAVEEARSEIRNAKKNAMSSTQSAADLIKRWERWMDRYFEVQEHPEKIFAIIWIAVREFGADRAFLDNFSVKAILEAAKFSAKIAGLMFVLERLGPLGRVLKLGIQAALALKGRREDIGTIVAIGHWLIRASTVKTFSMARGWAYFGTEIASELGAMLAGELVNVGKKVISGAKDFAMDALVPKRANEVKALVDGAVTDPATRKVLVDNTKSALAERLEKGHIDDDTRFMASFVHQMDSAAYADLKQRYPNRLPAADPDQVRVPDTAPDPRTAIANTMREAGRSEKEIADVQSKIDAGQKKIEEAKAANKLEAASTPQKWGGGEGARLARDLGYPVPPSKNHYWRVEDGAPVLRRRRKYDAAGKPVDDLVFNPKTFEFDVRPSTMKKATYKSKEMKLELGKVDPVAKVKMDALLLAREVERAKRNQLQAQWDSGKQDAATKDALSKARGKVVKYSNDIGEVAASTYAMQRIAKEYPGQKVELVHGGPGTTSRSLDLDQVYRVEGKNGEPDQYIVVEAKGGSSQLGSRMDASGNRVEQGTPEYLKDVVGRRARQERDARIAARRAGRPDPGPGIYTQLKASMAAGGTRYFVVRAPIGTKDGASELRDIRGREFDQGP